MLVDNQVSNEALTSGLVARIEGGDRIAEEELVNHYWKGLYFILNRRSNDVQLAADIAQETFIVVISKARDGKIQNPVALPAFIRQTGINLMIGHFRKESRRATDAFGEVNVEIPDYSNDVVKAVESREAVRLVQQLVDELKVQRDRAILDAYYMKGDDKTKICQRLELSPEHFDRVLYRARQRLKQLMEFKLGESRVP